MTSIGQVLNPGRESGISLCHYHGNNEVIYTCNDCDGMMACAECVTTTHQGHSLYKLKDTATYVWENLVSSYISKSEKLEIPKVITEMKIADGRIQANRKHFQELVAEIQYRGEMLKNEVDKITMKLVESVTHAAKENADCLRDYKKELDELHADTLYIVRKCKQAEESGEYKIVFEFEKEIRSGLKLPRVPITQTTSFLGRSMLETKQDVEDIFGSVTIIGKKKPQTSERKRAPKSAKANRSNLVSEFRYLSEITSMLPTPENTWVSNSDSKDIVLIDHTGEEKQKIELDIHVNDICISPDTGNIWFSSGYDYSIRELTSQTSAEVRFCISSVPLALCITPDHKIAVATFRRVSIHNKEGVEMFATTAGKDGGQQIASPRHIRSCPLSGNIAVADFDERSHGGKGKPCITVLNSSLQTLFKFPNTSSTTNGNKTSKAQGRSSFLPYDVCYDTAGTLFVADHSSKSVMMVSSRGEFLATMYTDQEFGPQTLGIQPGNLLWTGFSYGIVKVLKYKI